MDIFNSFLTFDHVKSPSQTFGCYLIITKIHNMLNFRSHRKRPFIGRSQYLYLSIFTLMLIGCGKGCGGCSGNEGGGFGSAGSVFGGNSSALVDASLSNPVDIVFSRKSAAILDDKNHIWQWEFDKQYNVTNLTRIELPDIQSIVLNRHDGIGWAINKKGEVWRWNFFIPTVTEHLKSDKPVKKVATMGEFAAILHTDGTIMSNGGKSWMGMGSPNTKNDAIDYAAFSGIKDIYWGGNYLVAINQAGECFGASGKGLNSLIVTQPPTSDGKPVKIQGLPPIKRFYESERFYYAFGEGNTIHYWNQSFDKKGIQTLNVQGNNVTYDRVLTPQGVNYQLTRPQTSGELIQTGSSDNLDQPQGYGIWYLDYYAKKVVGLDLEGKLWLYDYDPKKPKGSRISNPKRIGDFKVNLAYYKS